MRSTKNSHDDCASAERRSDTRGLFVALYPLHNNRSRNKSSACRSSVNDFTQQQRRQNRRAKQDGRSDDRARKRNGKHAKGLGQLLELNNNLQGQPKRGRLVENFVMSSLGDKFRSVIEHAAESEIQITIAAKR